MPSASTTAHALPAAPPAPARPLIGTGTVRHRRLRPVEHGFAYPTWFLLLPMRQLRAQPEPALRRNRAGWASFHDADHGDGGPDALAWAERQLANAGIEADGEIWLHTLPRILGYAFKPVSFWYCHRRDGTLVALIAEVNSTFGERHAYLMSGPSLGWGRPIEADKRMQVSPFARIEGRYRFHFMRTASAAGSTANTAANDAANDAGRTVVRIDYHDDQGPLLLTSVSGHLQPLNAARLRAAVVRMPLLTLGIIARIHWQAVKLWVRRVPFIGVDGRVPDAEDQARAPTAPHAPLR